MFKNILIYEEVFMDNKLLKLPILAVIGGIILRIIDRIAISILVRGTTDSTSEIGTKFFYINLISNIVIFIIIGKILKKNYDRKTLFKSATLLVIYSFLIFGLSEILQYFGIYPITSILILSLPTEIFSIITSILRSITSTQNITLIRLFIIIENFAPYLFLLFVKEPVKAK